MEIWLSIFFLYLFISVPEVINIARLKDGLNVAELFHGPTLAFKDLALTFVGELYNYFLEKSKKKCIIVVGNQCFSFEINGTNSGFQ